MKQIQESGFQVGGNEYLKKVCNVIFNTFSKQVKIISQKVWVNFACFNSLCSFLFCKQIHPPNVSTPCYLPKCVVKLAPLMISVVDNGKVDAYHESTMFIVILNTCQIKKMLHRLDNVCIHNGDWSTC